MKIKLLTQIKKGGQIYTDGDILDIEDHKIDKWIKMGWGELIDKKEKKIKKKKGLKTFVKKWIPVRMVHRNMFLRKVQIKVK